MYETAIISIIRLIPWAALAATIVLTSRWNNQATTESPDAPSQTKLSSRDKVWVWILCFLDPIINGAIFYFGLRKKSPARAKEANQISWWSFLAVFLLGITLIIIGSKLPQDSKILKFLSPQSTEEYQIIEHFNDKLLPDLKEAEDKLNRGIDNLRQDDYQAAIRNLTAVKSDYNALVKSTDSGPFTSDKYLHIKADYDKYLSSSLELIDCLIDSASAEKQGGECNDLIDQIDDEAQELFDDIDEMAVAAGFIKEE
jgi:hypothetical protein